MGRAFLLRRRRIAGMMALGAAGLVALAVHLRTRDPGSRSGSFMVSRSGLASSCCCHYVKPLPFVADRDEIGRLLEEEKMTVGAELGVQRGVYAETLLTQWTTCTKYILVDLWRQQLNYDDVANVDDAEQEEILRDARARLTKFEKRGTQLEYMRMLTTEAAAKIPDGSLDFVYIDARHDYCGCKQDIELYWPKLREGGILAGHDYALPAMWEATGQDWALCADGTRQPLAVLGAVNEFARDHELQVVATLFDDPRYHFPSFMVRKPTTRCEQGPKAAGHGKTVTAADE